MKTITKRIRDERREKANKRNEKYAALSKDEKLARLPSEGAKKQRARLEGN